MRGGVHRALWRWHSWAGIIVLPILAWMAVTGALYLYKAEIERTFYGSWIELPTAVRPMLVADMIRAVEGQTHGRVRRIERPAAANESWRLTYEAAGEERLAFVRPDTGAVLGTSRAGGPMAVLKDLHSLAITGTVGNAVVEIAAGWAIILVLTGFFLWWPRRSLSLAGRPSGRRFWRNLHASVGVLAGAVILFLAVTGMPWTLVWGGQFHAFVARQQIGRPAAPIATRAGHDGHDEHLAWSMRGQPQPAASGAGDIGPDRAIAAAGLPAPWILDLPRGPGGAYRLSAVAVRAQDVRLVHVNPADGRVLQDVSAANFGIGARAFEWGVAAHQGQQYGEANRLVMLAGCIGLLLLTLSAPVMWWKRKGQARPAPSPDAVRGVAIIMILAGLLFPLTGATMILALLVQAMIGDLDARRRVGLAGD